MPAQPIRRNPHIVPLSHDHHQGLLFCWKIRQGLIRQVAPHRIAAYIHYFWQHHLEPHFREEEDILFILPDDDRIGQALREHRQIRDLVAAITPNPTIAQQFSTLADTVDQHIRFEERDLFPYLERTLTPDQLATIGQQLKEEPPHADTYSDEFWVRH